MTTVKQSGKRHRGQFVKNDPRINRAGRPRLAESLAEAIRQAGGEVIDGETRRDRAIRKLWELAEDGNLSAAELVFTRGWGRVVESEIEDRLRAVEGVYANGQHAVVSD